MGTLHIATVVLGADAKSVVREVSKKWPGVTLDLFQHTDIPYGEERIVWALHRIVVGEKSRGVGTEIMRFICDRADEIGAIIALTPSTDFGGSSVNRLKKFYRRFGFRPNKDYSISETMVRNPQ